MSFYSLDASTGIQRFLGFATNSPYTLVWTNVPAGNWTISAQAIDNVGASTRTDSGVVLQVNPIPPPNDNFAEASLLAGTNVSVIGTTVAATLENGELDWNGGGSSVWYSWKAPADGQLQLAMPDWSYATYFGAYSGTSLSNLTLVANDLAPFGGWFISFDAKVQAGETYQIVVAGAGGPIDHFTLNLHFLPRPSNDDFEQRAVLPGTGGVVMANNSAASFQPGEPSDLPPNVYGYGPSYHTLWWTWTAPFGGQVNIQPTCNTAYLLGIYSGTVLSNLTTVTKVLDGGTILDVAAGTTFQISIDGFAEQSGPFQLGLTLTPRPSNDDFANSQLVSGSVTALEGSTVAATTEPGEPCHAGACGGRTIWWKWVAPLTGLVTITPATNSSMPIVAVYTGSVVSNLTTVASSVGGNLNFEVIAGATYQIAAHDWQGANYNLNLVLSTVTIASPFDGAKFVNGSDISLAASITPNDGNVVGVDFFQNGILLGSSTTPPFSIIWSNAPGGDYKLNAVATDDLGIARSSPPVSISIRPTNDSFTNASVLSGAVVNATGSTIGATSEAGEPAYPFPAANHSIWWTWTAPGNGVVTLSTAGSSVLPVVSVYTGEVLSNLTLISTLDTYFTQGNPCGQFAVQAGVTYHLSAVESYFQAGGDIHLGLSFAPPPSNDNFANRMALTGPLIAVTNVIGSATEEIGEPGYNATGHSIWWSWTASQSGTVAISASGSCGTPTLGVYTGSSVSNLTQVTTGSGLAKFMAAAGTTYQIAEVTGSCGDAAALVDLQLLFETAPASNDQFANRIPLVGTNLTTSGSTVLATHEAGEPVHGSYPGSNSIWWTWTAPVSGTLSLSVTGDGLVPTWAVYTGASLPSLVPVMNSYAAPWGGIRSSGITLVQAGTTYQIAVDGTATADGGPVGTVYLKLALDTAPVNDDFANRIPITQTVTHISATTAGATLQVGEPNPDGYPGGHSLWWSFTAPDSGWVQLDTFGSSVTTLAGIYTGDALSNLTTVARGNASYAPVLFPCLAGATYQIALDHWYPDMFGPVVLNLLFSTLELTAPTNQSVFHGTTPISLTAQVSHWDGDFTSVDFLSDRAVIGTVTNSPYSFIWNNPPLGSHLLQVRLMNTNAMTRISPTNVVYIRPANDDFANRTIISADAATLDAQGIGATLEPGEPVHGPVSGESVWWSWTAPASGRLTLSKPADINARYGLMAVYTGSTLTNLSLVTNTPANGSGTLTSSITLDVQSGIEYQIAVAGSFFDLADLPIRLSLARAPTNDQFTSRATLSGLYPSVAGNNINATKDPGEPNNAGRSGGRSIWWTWTAPESNSFTLIASGSGFSPLLGVYTGTQLSNLVIVASSASSSLTFHADAGTTYQIVLDGDNGGYGSFSLQLLPVPSNDYFTNRLLLTGTSAPIVANNQIATSEPGEWIPDGASGKTLWWSWTAATNETVALSIADNPFGDQFDDSQLRGPRYITGPLVSIFTGDSLTNLSLVASNSTRYYYGPFLGPILIYTNCTFEAVAGTTYSIAIDGCNGSAGSFELSLTASLPHRPPNDDFEFRTLLTGENPVFTGQNRFATREANEPAHGNGATGASVWWTWTAPASGLVTVNADEANFTALFAVYTGDSVATLVPTGGGAGNIQFRAKAGTTYQIALDSFGLNGGGEAILSLKLSRSPSNDDFASRIPLLGVQPEIYGSNINATSESGEPDMPGTAIGASVWYTWTAPSSGNVLVTLANGSQGLPFAIYAGQTLTNLQLLAHAPDAEGYYLPTFYALAGTTYQIAVSDDAGTTGQFGLLIFAPPLPPSLATPDHFSSLDGKFHLRIQGTLGQSLAVQASTNLLNWETIDIDTLPGTSLDFVDPDAGLFPQRFYRVLPLDAIFDAHPLGIHSPAPVSTTGFPLHVMGPAGQPFRIQASADLLNWSDLSTGVLVNGAFDFIDSSAPEFTRRFYRVIKQ